MSVLIVVAFLMLALGMAGQPAVAAVLGVAAFTCTSASVAGEMMQDLKAGHILGCTPWRMQVGDLFGITGAALVMFLVLTLLHMGDVKRAVGVEMEALAGKGITAVESKAKDPALAGRSFTLAEVQALAPEQQNDVLGTQAGFGGEKLPAPQASLMAVVARGIVEGKAEMILILVGMFMGAALILMQVKSPMPKSFVADDQVCPGSLPFWPPRRGMDTDRYRHAEEVVDNGRDIAGSASSDRSHA